MADVIAIIVADVIATLLLDCIWLDVIANSVWQILLPLRLMLLPTIILLADAIANYVWQMLLPLRLMLLPTKICFG